MSEAMALLAQLAVMAGLLVFIAAVIESVVEFAAASWLKKILPDVEWRTIVLKWFAAVIGVLFCFIWGVNLISAAMVLFGFEPLHSGMAFWFGIILTGLLIGRGSNWLHNFAKKYLGLDDVPGLLLSGEVATINLPGDELETGISTVGYSSSANQPTIKPI